MNNQPGMRPVLFLVAAIALLTACGDQEELAQKTADWVPPTYSSVAEFQAMIVDAPGLCDEGEATLQLDEDSVSAGIVIPLNRGSKVALQTDGAWDLDTVLAIYGPRDAADFFGPQAVAWDDDSGTNRLARIPEYVAEKTGLYLVYLSSWEGHGRGSVRISISVDAELGCVALRKDLPDLDVLFVVDNSVSMVPTQIALGRGIRGFLEHLDPAGDANLRFAVTTTAVCPAGKQGAGRGRFIYSPAKDLPPDGVARRTILCLTDEDCHANVDLPDSMNWVCDIRNIVRNNPWACDLPPDEDTGDPDDPFPGSLLMPVLSQCRYECSMESDSMACTRLFGVSPRCRVMCDAGACSVANCVSVGYPRDRCTRVCGSDSCQSFCEAYLGGAASCATACNEVGRPDCRQVCAGGIVAGDTISGIFPGRDFLCSVACEDAESCEGRCVAEFRNEGEQPYLCSTPPGSDGTQPGCLPQSIAQECPTGVPAILDSGVARYFVDLLRRGDWQGEPAWAELDDADLERRVLTRLLECQVMVGGSQAVCGSQEQGLRAAWLALDPGGENKDQSTQFLRADAYLLVVILSDEDDCSAPEHEKVPGEFANVVPVESYSRCACLRDEQGCLNGGQCDMNQCLEDGEFSASRCPLLHTSRFVTGLGSLKSDPDKVMLAVFGGDVVPESATSPSTDYAAIRQRYYECKCRQDDPFRGPYTYVCESDLGRADQGDRYADTVKGFGQQGWMGNVCKGLDLEGLADFITSVTDVEAQGN
jgi:hypothetical protein